MKLLEFLILCITITISLSLNLRKEIEHSDLIKEQTNNKNIKITDNDDTNNLMNNNIKLFFDKLSKEIENKSFIIIILLTVQINPKLLFFSSILIKFFFTDIMIQNYCPIFQYTIINEIIQIFGCVFCYTISLYYLLKLSFYKENEKIYFSLTDKQNNPFLILSIIFLFEIIRFNTITNEQINIIILGINTIAIILSVSLAIILGLFLKKYSSLDIIILLSAIYLLLFAVELTLFYFQKK
jgi:putative Ca2+/H+ antiporter (TMEM165/GDT1 family)